MADKKAAKKNEDQTEDPLLIRWRKMSRPVRVVYARPRTFIAVAVGIVAFLLLPGSLRLVTGALIASCRAPRQRMGVETKNERGEEGISKGKGEKRMGR